MASIYGVDLLSDNVLACRERLYDIWNTEYEKVCAEETNPECRAAVRFILSRNVVCGNALTMMCVDENQRDTKEPIVFSEWSMPFNDTRIQRRDFIFSEMLEQGVKADVTRRTGQQNMFGEDGEDAEPRFLEQYIFDYRKEREYDI